MGGTDRGSAPDRVVFAADGASSVVSRDLRLRDGGVSC